MIKNTIGGLTAALVLTGCYTFVPVGETAPKEGAENRIELAQAMDWPHGDLLIRDVVRLDGTVYAVTSDTLAMSVIWVRTQLGERYHANGMLYYLPMSAVASQSTRSLQPAQTVVAGAIVVGAGVGVLNFVADGGGGNNNGKNPGPIEPRVEIPIPR